MIKAPKEFSLGPTFNVDESNWQEVKAKCQKLDTVMADFLQALSDGKWPRFLKLENTKRPQVTTTMGGLLPYLQRAVRC